MPTQHFADRLTDAVRQKGNSLCVGLDPRWDKLPSEIRARHGCQNLQAVAAAFEEFCLRVIDAVAQHVPIVKPQSAFFEACGPAGLTALQKVLRHAREQDLITILDSKRNDIASTATAYANAAFEGVKIDGQMFPVWDADALTINPYLGRDAVEPFLQCARKGGRGVFVLVRTSNAGAGQFQDLICEGKPVFQHVGDAVAAWSRENVGECGFGDVAAVVGATHPRELKLLRGALSGVWFLIPGFGAQGGSASDVAAGFESNGLGAIVNSSRGIISCFEPDEKDWETKIVHATDQSIKLLREVSPMRELYR